MFHTNSRYIDIDNASLQKENGRTIIYKKRRFLPNNSNMKIIHEIQVTKGDRPDTIATRITGDPEQFWRICDSNNIMHPFDLVKTPGSTIKIAGLGS